MKNRDSPSKHVSSTATSQFNIKHLVAFTFSTTVALATVLIVLILCEISNSFDPATRGIALRTTIFVLLFLLIVALPALEIQSIISAAGYEFTGVNRGILRLAWVLQALFTLAWLLAFWWSGAKALGQHQQVGFSPRCSMTASDEKY